jgi:HPt (histidine-containing phosphotransfer) domain-containing protein
MPYLEKKVTAQSDLPFLTTQIHALKSASASIGAKALAAEAARLENAGKRGDITLLCDGLPVFHEELASLTDSIRAALRDLPAQKPDAAPPPPPGNPSPALRCEPDREVLLRMKDALFAEDVGEVEAFLHHLEATHTGEKDFLSALSDCILLSDFHSAIALLDGALERATV